MDGSNPYTLSDYESFTIGQTNTDCPYDGFVTIAGSVSWSQIYVNDVLIGLTTDTSSKASGITIVVNKGDKLRWGAYAPQWAYARWYKGRI